MVVLPKEGLPEAGRPVFAGEGGSPFWGVLLLLPPPPLVPLRALW